MATLEQYLNEFKDTDPVYMDERRIAFLSTRSGYMQIWEKDLKTGDIRQRTFFKSTVMSLLADEKNKCLLFTLDTNGSENGQPFLLGYDEEEPRQLLDRPKYMHYICGMDAEGRYLYYLSNAADGVISDLCRLDIATGEEKVLFKPAYPNAMECGMSPDRRYVLFHIMRSYESDRICCFDTQTNAAFMIPDDDQESSEGNPMWTPDGKSVFLVSFRGKDRSYAARFDMEAKSFTLIYECEKGECRCAAPSPDGKYIAVAVEEEGYAHIDLLDGKAYKYLRSVFPLQASMGPTSVYREKVSWSADGSYILFQMTNGTHPQRLWTYYPETDTFLQLTKGGVVPQEDLVDMELHEFRSFDGTRVPFFLYKPKGKENEKDLPVLLEIHGGPECQRYCEYDPYLQFILSRGIAVVAPNIRGSSGYGRYYCHMDDKEKRLDSVKDIEWLVKYITENHIADPKRIAVSGISYGGFMTLSCVARLPDLWACAVDRVGMFNLRTFMENTSPYRRAWRASEYGSLEDGDLLYRVSPAAAADNMKTPLIVVHGDNDPRVPISETEQLVSILEKKGVEVQFIRYADEGHEVRKYPNVVDSITRTSNFVLKYIGDK